MSRLDINVTCECATRAGFNLSCTIASQKVDYINELYAPITESRLLDTDTIFREGWMGKGIELLWRDGQQVLEWRNRDPGVRIGSCLTALTSYANCAKATQMENMEVATITAHTSLKTMKVREAGAWHCRGGVFATCPRASTFVI